MFSIFVACRHVRSKVHQGFISFVSMASVLGIALGVMVLITVLSVMNGFEQEIHQRLFSMARHLTVQKADTLLEDWPALQTQVNQVQGVDASAPYIDGQGLLSHEGHVVPALVHGVSPEQEGKVSALLPYLKYGQLSDLKPKAYEVILGVDLAQRLHVGVGDEVTLISPQAKAGLLGFLPRFRNFHVVGLFQAGSQFGFDGSLAMVHLQDAQALYQLGQGVSGLRLKLQDPTQVGHIRTQLQQALPLNYEFHDWTEQYGSFFKAIALEKKMMFLILSLIIAVGVFNLVSSLVMVVNEKRAEIAILRTMGATTSQILTVFFIQGQLIGLLGLGLGAAGGISLSQHATAVVQWIEQMAHIKLVSSSVYFVDYLPSQLLWSDVLQVCGFAWVLCALAALYPAWRATRFGIAQVLRYE